MTVTNYKISQVSHYSGNGGCYEGLDMKIRLAWTSCEKMHKYRVRYWWWSVNSIVATGLRPTCIDTIFELWIFMPHFTPRSSLGRNGIYTGWTQPCSYNAADRPLSVPHAIFVHLLAASSCWSNFHIPSSIATAFPRMTWGLREMMKGNAVNLNYQG